MTHLLLRRTSVPELVEHDSLEQILIPVINDCGRKGCGYYVRTKDQL